VYIFLRGIIMFEKLKKVYNLLEDGESKIIFLNRVLYNITNEDYISPIIEIYLERLVNHIKANSDITEELYNCVGNKKLIIYGIGTYGKYFAMLFKNNVFDKIDIEAFYDRKADKVNEFFGYKVIDKETLVRDYSDCAVLITDVDGAEEIFDSLISLGFNKENIITNLMLFEYFSYEKNPLQYFDDVVKLTNNEVFLDVGCFDCSTTLNFIKRCPDYKKIIAFEPNKYSFYECKKIAAMHNIDNFIIYKLGAWDKKEVLSFFESKNSSCIGDNGTKIINADSIDNILNGDEATFIKMDIEGTELKALMGAEKTIKKYKPKLAISIYHKPSDIVEIPLYINSLVPNYKFYIRHYSMYIYETVLYAIPE